MAKRKVKVEPIVVETQDVSPQEVLPPKEEQEKVVMVMDRYLTYSRCCLAQQKREDKTCSLCGKTFTHVTTECPLTWMPDTVKSIRPDLIFIKKEDI